MGYPYKEPRTEIKAIKGGYYKYQISYKYNPTKKRTDKITGPLLGKITQEDGFIPSDKDQLREQLSPESVDIKEFGLSHMFLTLLSDELDSFKKLFSDELGDVLFAFALFRWGYSSPIKRAVEYYNHSYCFHYLGKRAITDKKVSSALKYVGEHR